MPLREGGLPPDVCPGCGARLQEPPAETRAGPPLFETALDPASVGPRLGGYEILACIGRGAMGSVYKARQVALDRIVAIKTVREDLCADPDLIGRFLREARTIGQFNTEHVVQIYDAGFDQGHHFIVMEFVGGGNLRTYASKQPRSRLSAKDTLRFLHEASKGLLEAERLKIVHRDIKPGNLLLDARGRLKIADFGIAKVLGPDLGATATFSNVLVGTPLYMSPEQAKGGALDHRSDMYSLGATMFHLLTGAPPVEAESIPEAIRKKSDITRLRPRLVPGAGDIPESLARIIERMTALVPEERYPSFQELIRDLVLAGRTAAPEVPLRPRPGGGPPREKGRRMRWTAVAAVACVLVSLLILYGALTRPPRERQPGPAAASGAPGLGATEGPGGQKVAAEAPSTSGEGLGPDASLQNDFPDSPIPARPRPVETSAVEVSAALDRMRTALATGGPTKPLLGEAVALRDRLQGAGPPSRHWLPEADALIRDLEEGESRREAVEAVDAEPLLVKPPFAKAVERWQALEEILKPPAGAGTALVDWLREERERRLRQLEEKCSLAASFLLEDVKREATRFEAWRVEPDDFALLVRQLEESRDALLSAFGRCDIGEEVANGLKVALSTRAEAVRALADLTSSVDRIGGRLAGIGCASLWTPEAEGEAANSIREISETLRKLEATEPGAPLAPGRERLEKVESAAERLGEERALWLGALESFGARDLEEAERALGGMLARRPNQSGVERLLEASQALRRGFDALLARLDADRARRDFDRALELLENLGVGGAAAYAAECRHRLRALEDALPSMAPVPGGEALIPDRRSPRHVAVEPFFIDRYEVSVGEYREFVRTHAAAGEFQKVKDLWPDEETFRQFGSGAALSPPYLSEQPDIDATFPVEEVNYHQARAFLRSRRKDLPRLAEWFLAARGRPVRGEYPYELPSLEIHDRSQTPLPVARSGEARGFPPRCSVHHLAGNVAEWCLLEGEDEGTAPLVGGRYADTDRRYFTGERRDSLPLSARRRGYGFRGVIRPRAFFSDLLPAGSASPGIGSS